MKIFKTLFLIGSFLTLTFVAGAQWSKLPGPTGGPNYMIKQVGNEIWAAGNIGLFTSSTNGLTWQQSNLITGMCHGFESYNDTVVLLYVEYLSSNFKAYTKSSFDGGITWQQPVFIDNPTHFSSGIMFKTGKALYYQRDGIYYKSTNGGMTWNLHMYFGGYEIYDFYTNGIMGIATVDMPGHLGYVYSLNGTNNWTFLDSTYQPSHIFCNNSDIYFVDYDFSGVPQYKLIRTADYGATWDTCQATINGSIFNSLIYDGNLYVYGNADTLVSTDNGFTWLPGSLPDYRLWRPGVILPNGNKVGLDLNGEIFTYFPSTGVSVITNTGIANSQFNCIYSDNNVLFASTYRGLFRSTDAGITWNSVINQPAHAMLFMGDTVLAAHLTGNSRFLRSFDHGISWDTLPLPTKSSSSKTGIVELNGKIYVSGNVMIYSDDLGISWDSLPELPIVIGGSCLISNTALTGKIQVAYGKLFCVADNGYVFEFDFTSQNWIVNSCFLSSAFSQNEMHLADGKLVLSGGMGFFTSSDSGLTWIESTYNGVPPGEAPFGLLSIDSVWFSTARYDGVIFSTDFGQTWATIDSVPAFFALNQMCSLNNVLYVLSLFDGAFSRQNVFYSVSGNVFNDANNNGMKDSGENGIAHALISTNPASYIASTDTAGNYTLYTDINGLIEAIPPSTFTSVNPSSYVSSGTASGVDFGFYIAPGINDLQADLTNASVFSPGFNTTLILNAKNIGSAISSPVFTLLLDSNLILESSIPAPASTNGDTIVWNMSSINFMEEVSVSAIVKTDIGTPLGTPITCSLKVEPDINDVTPADNISVINSVVLASFDPNDKTCLQGEFYSTVQLSNSEELVYIVRFQNTGNLTTSFVNITDTLSSLLDLSTFRMVSTSHLCNWTLSNTGILRVEFNPIALPPSSVDELASHGFIKYAINCKESVVAGNAIANQAQIYFDFNTPIATNQVVTLLHEPGIVSVSDPVQITEEIVAYPNPTNNFVNFHFANSIHNESSIVKVYNMMGAFMSEKSFIGKSGKIDVSSFPAGIYVTVIYNSSGKRLGSFRFVRVD